MKNTPVLLIVALFTCASCCVAQDLQKCSDYNSLYSQYTFDSMLVNDNYHHQAGYAHPLSITSNIHSYCHYTGGGGQLPGGDWACLTYGASTGSWSYAEPGHYSVDGIQHCPSIKYQAYGPGGVADDLNTYSTGATAENEIPSSLPCTGNGENITITQNNNSSSVSYQSQGPYAAIWYFSEDSPPLDCPFEASVTGTPLVIAMNGASFQSSFTDYDSGVQFGLASEDETMQMSWTKKGADVAFVVLPDAAGHVYSLKTGMFGNLTRQTPKIGEKLGGRYPNPYKSNGFEALAYLDEIRNGGNGNGQFDPGDSAWSRVRVWTNRAHDGIYDELKKPDEVRTLDALGILSIDVVNYTSTPDADGHGNKKLWKGSLVTNDKNPMEIYDVQLVIKKP